MHSNSLQEGELVERTEILIMWPLFMVTSGATSVREGSMLLVMRADLPK